MDHRKSHFHESRVNSGVKIFLGDSLTEYGEWSEMFPNYNLLNRGIAGDGIQGIQNRLLEISRHEPSTVFLMVGVNDLQFHPSQYVINRYIALLDLMRKELVNATIVVQSILPINNAIYQYNTTNSEIDKVNKALQDYCKRHSIEYIDIAGSLKDAENSLKLSFTSDGIHINGIAYNIWKEKLSTWFPKK